MTLDNITRRTFLELLGAGALAGCATPGGIPMYDPRFRYYDGGGFYEHIREGGQGAKDWYTSDGLTLVTPMAEGKVIIAREFQPRRASTKQFHVSIEHFGGRITDYHHLTRSFVETGDYVGRNNIIGMGGGHTRSNDGSMPPPHIHIEFLVDSDIYNLMKDNKSPVQNTRIPYVRLDPERQGKNGKRVQIWNGKTDYGHLERNEQAVAELQELFDKAPGEVQNLAKSRIYNRDVALRMYFGVVPQISHDSVKFYTLYESALSIPTWVSDSDKNKLKTLMEYYVNNHTVLTIPFVNPKLFTEENYTQGSKAKSLQEFKKLYAQII